MQTQWLDYEQTVVGFTSDHYMDNAVGIEAIDCVADLTRQTPTTTHLIADLRPCVDVRFNPVALLTHIERVLLPHQMDVFVVVGLPQIMHGIIRMTDYTVPALTGRIFSVATEPEAFKMLHYKRKDGVKSTFRHPAKH